MNLIIKRRQLILGTLVLALGAAVFVNWYYTNNGKKSLVNSDETEYVQNLGEAQYVNAEAQGNDYFAELRLNRDKARDEAVGKLNKSLEKAVSGSDEAKSITTQINAISKQIKLENDLETLVSAKISATCVAVINDNSVQIVVEKGKLNESAPLLITDIVTANTDIEGANIKISEAK